MAGKAGVKKAVNGLGMLLYQGALSFEIWTCKRPPIDVMKKRFFDIILTPHDFFVDNPFKEVYHIKVFVIRILSLWAVAVTENL